MRFRTTTILFIVTLLATPANSTTIYVYENQHGSRIISNQLSSDRSLRLLKKYTSHIPVQSYQRKQKYSIKRKLDPRRTKFDQTIFELADSYKQDRALIKAIVHVESSFNPHALSPKGAQGLMQLMPGTANSYKVLRPFDAHDNLRGGIEYFSDLMLRYENNIRFALAAYNAGEGAVSKYQGIPPYPETQAYLKNVLRLHKNYQRFTDTYSWLLLELINNEQNRAHSKRKP